MSAGFTPGPWEWDLFASGYSLVGPYPANGGNVRPRVLISHSKPDGALIAAAPTMAGYIQRKADEGDAEAAQIMEAVHGRA